MVAILYQVQDRSRLVLGRDNPPIFDKYVGYDFLIGFGGLTTSSFETNFFDHPFDFVQGRCPSLFNPHDSQSHIRFAG